MSSIDSLLLKINAVIINPALAFLFILAFAYFSWGVMEYFLYQDNETERKTGQKHIMYGLIGLVIMAGFWGIIEILSGTIGVSVPRP